MFVPLEFNAVVRLYLKVVTLKRVTCIYIWLKAASLIVRGAAKVGRPSNLCA